jgi:hypothetical protein
MAGARLEKTHSRGINRGGDRSARALASTATEEEA